MKVVVTMTLEIPLETDEDDLDHKLRMEKLEGCIERYLKLHDIHLCAYIHNVSWRMPHVEDGWMWDDDMPLTEPGRGH